MAITASYGYNGSITEGPWSEMATALGAEYGVIAAGDWRVTAKPAADRTVLIADGSGYGHGVFDKNVGAVEIQLPVVASGTRYDLIVARRTWGTNTTTFAYVTGGSTGGVLPTRTTGPGVVDEQPLALVGLVAGQSQPSQIIDLRVHQANGGAAAQSDLVLQYLERPGTRLRTAKGVYWNRSVVNGTPSWVRERPIVPLLSVGAALFGTAAVGNDHFEIAGQAGFTTNSNGDLTIVFPNDGFPNGLLSLQATLMTGAGVVTPVPAFLTIYPPGSTAPNGPPTPKKFAGRVWQSNGAPWPNGAFAVAYTAIGW